MFLELLKTKHHYLPVVMQNIIDDFREVIVRCIDPSDNKHLHREIKTFSNRTNGWYLTRTGIVKAHCFTQRERTEANSLLSSGSIASWTRMDGSFWRRSSSSRRRCLSSSLPFQAVTGLNKAFPAALRLSRITTWGKKNPPVNMIYVRTFLLNYI